MIDICSRMYSSPPEYGALTNSHRWRGGIARYEFGSRHVWVALLRWDTLATYEIVAPPSKTRNTMPTHASHSPIVHSIPAVCACFAFVCSVHMISTSTTDSQNAPFTGGQYQRRVFPTVFLMLRYLTLGLFVSNSYQNTGGRQLPPKQPVARQRHQSGNRSPKQHLVLVRKRRQCTTTLNQNRDKGHVPRARNASSRASSVCSNYLFVSSRLEPLRFYAVMHPS